MFTDKRQDFNSYQVHLKYSKTGIVNYQLIVILKPQDITNIFLIRTY